MPSTNLLIQAAKRLPALKKMSALQLVAVGEVLLLARDHVQQLTPQERKRVVALVRAGRGRPRRHLTESERQELIELIQKAQPRVFAGEAIDAFSPVHLPRRLVYGRNGKRR